MAVKVFCSHRGVDKPEVEAFARRLRDSGIDAWFDKWEIAPGDDIVARMNAGLDENAVGLVFFSNKEHHGKWFRAEVATLTFEMIENGKRLIPVMIDADAPLPPFVRPRARRGIDEFDAIVDAIKGIHRKPPLGPETPATAAHRFVVQLDAAKAAAGRIDLVARLDDLEVGRSESLPLPRAAGLNFAEFLHGGFAEAFRSPADAARQSLEHALAQLGDELGNLLFAGPVGSALNKAIAEFTCVGHELELIFETASPALLGLPFEAARLPDGRTPALLPAVSVLRRVSGAPAAHHPPLAGPLKILAAVGAPDESQTHNAVLDLEHELQGILDALEKAAEHGNAQVRILEIGHPDAIRDALAADQYHVLHLSCHGSPGQIELEDEDGAPVPVSAADFANALRAARRPLPLVFLATCHGGSPAGEAGSFAQALVQAGVPEVLAMQTQISDRYASELAAAFYGQLNTPDRPTAGRALAHARQTLETARRRQSPPPRPEYATATLFVAGTESPLLDRNQAQAPLARTPVHHTDAAGLPCLKVGDLIGRRPELRQALAILRDKPEALARYGQRAGIVLQGMGGVGKSALAGRIMARLGEEGWTCVAIAGAFNIDTLACALGLPTGGDDARLRAIRQRLQREKLLLVLDNFETNLTVGGAAWRDDTVGEWLGYLCQSAGKGRLLLTSRHRPPGHDAWLETLPLPPLSTAETRKLILRLPQLAGSKGDDLRAILQRIGGHPRMLEYLDAVLHRGVSRLTEIRQRLQAQAATLGVNLKARPADLDEAIATSLRLGAHDILLAELLALASDQARAVLLQAAASNLPISAAGIAHALNDGPPSAADIERVHLDLENLAELSLLVFVADDEVFVHRWTAECLLHAGPEHDESALRAPFTPAPAATACGASTTKATPSPTAWKPSATCSRPASSTPPPMKR
ncbi:MAG: CHAT domain-containing protein [Zoogloea sp.]|nr:CHAT domain-containing protein [Zoogloea sp.]